MDSKIDVTTEENWMKYAAKADYWSKNEKAHQIMRIRSKNCQKLCVICMGRKCYRGMDSTPIYGRKSMKKSKYVRSHRTKMFDRSVVNLYFIDRRNGERRIDDINN